MATPDDRGVGGQFIPGEMCFVLVLCVFLWSPVLKMHSEASAELCGCVTDVVYLSGCTVPGGTLVALYHIGLFQCCGVGSVVAHDQ